MSIVACWKVVSVEVMLANLPPTTAEADLLLKGQGTGDCDLLEIYTPLGEH